MEKICSGCSEPTLAQSLCTRCNKWLCCQCTEEHQHPHTDLHHQQRPGAAQCPDRHQRGSSPVPPTGQGPGSYPCPLLMCHSHRQEPLELFCESCDLLCCSSCHLSSHKNHRVVQMEKALQDQQWLFESLTVQVDERKSAVENNAKQMEDRLHGVKIAHRKAENQIKMAKMIMMNELNKRANLLIEQLEKISENFQQHLEDQLQGAIEVCGQLDRVHRFISWASTHHRRGPVLFSRALLSLQMQQLFETSLYSESWSPVKIKFDWDASYWMKQMSTLGQLSVEGGHCSYPQGLSCTSIMRPQPMACLALPPVFHRREPACGYQSCCEPQMCCLHGIPSQQDLDKNPVDAALFSSGCGQPALISASLQKCWDTEGSSRCPPPASAVQCSRGSADASQSQLQSKPYLPYHQHQFQDGAECRRSAPYQGKVSCLAAADREGTAEESWEERGTVEDDCGDTENGGRQDEELQQEEEEEEEQRPVQQQQQLQQHQQQLQQRGAPPAAELRREPQRPRPAQTAKHHRNAKRSTSLEVSLTARDGASEVQSSRLSPTAVCTRRTRRSQSIPAEMAAPCGSSPYPERPTRCSLEAGAANKADGVDPRQRRASDGVLCVVKENSSDTGGHCSPPAPYKTEPDNSFICVNEEVNREVKEKSTASRSGHSRDAQKDSGRTRVPVVCLERLKILVSQLPPHGRRQSDPLPVVAVERSVTLPQQPRRISTISDTRRTIQSLTAPQYAAETLSSSPTLSSSSDFDSGGRFISCKASALSFADPKYVSPSFPALDMDSGSNPRPFSEDTAVSGADPDPPLNSDTSSDSDPNTESLSEAELQCEAPEKSASADEMRLRRETDIAGDSELEYEEDQDSDGGLVSEDGQELKADAESESDIQPEFDHSFHTGTVSDQAPDSQSELDLESEAEFATDDPQPLRSDLEEESHTVIPGQRPLLIANPQRGMEDVHSEQDNAEMESEDFCAVCLIGGDLLCCDRCPKVFHLSCHVPPLLSFPSGDWVCSLCRDALQPEVEYDCENERTSGEQTLTHGLSAFDQRKCERLTLLILSNILSAPFHEPVSPLARHYYQIIKRPMDLSVIRAKLQRRNPRHYNSADQFVDDFYLMFHNCAKFNYPDSEVAQAGRSLLAFFTSKLTDIFPDRVFPAPEADSDSDEYDEAYRSSENGFPWPERREQSYRKRKRRNSLRSKRHHF